MLKERSIISPDSSPASQRGFSIVEVLLAATVFGFLVTGLIGAVVYGRSSTANSGDHIRANLLAEEGIEATRNIGAASYANLVDTSGASSNVGDTTVEGGSDSNANGTSALKVTTGASSGTVSLLSAYIKTIDATNSHVQMALYADSSGTPGARLAVSSVQTAVANSWNTFSISSVTVTASTTYWIAISEDGTTQFADGGATGSVAAYHAPGGYPAPDPFGQTGNQTTDKPSFYMTVGSGGSYGLAQSGGSWAFTGTSDTADIFTRKITITTSSTNRKTVTSTVTWPEPGGTTGTVTLTAELTNWAAATKLWTNAVVAGSANPATAGVRVATQGNYAYEVLNGSTNNFVILNISNPASPSVVSTTSFSGTPTNIFVSGNYAYVTTSTNTTSLEIIDITTPATPVLKSSVSMTGAVAALGVFVSGNYAYVARASSITTGANEFTIVNVSSPTAPSVVGGYNNDIQMNEVYVSGNYAYVATSSTSAEMLVINVTTPASPTLAATYNPSTPNIAALTVTGYGSTVLLGMSTTLDAINVATPTAPARLGTFTAAGTIQDIDVDITNKYAFLSTTSTTGEFQVVNVTTPASMTLAKTVDVSGTTSTVNGIAYNKSLDIVTGSSLSTTQRFLTFTRN
ncbi:MAG TPA: hypothetical protein VLF60_05695 [Candidatus Saccharimonadales bacterium]|nr:hypothetical protein [Candidatus Saccharimonadales bacterium]